MLLSHLLFSIDIRFTTGHVFIYYCKKHAVIRTVWMEYALYTIEEDKFHFHVV